MLVVQDVNGVFAIRLYNTSLKGVLLSDRSMTYTIQVRIAWREQDITTSFAMTS